MSPDNVAGTAVRQLDASFSTNSNFEIYGLNLSNSTLSIGLLVGEADRGIIGMYNAATVVGVPGLLHSFTLYLVSHRCSSVCMGTLSLMFSHYCLVTGSHTLLLT